MKKYPFLFCGFTGLCLEILWTGLHSLLRGDASMKGTTSLLMFPIYGCASLILPVYKKLKSLPALLRGSLYTAGFYLAEFTSGSILQAFHMCPWDYSGVPHQYKGIIRLDYLPDLSVPELEKLLDLASDIEKNPKKYAHTCDDKRLATLFYEPSTRTRLSFEAAMMNLGGKVLGFSSADSSSAAKGETVADTIRVVSCYADICAMRHPKEGAPLVASMVSNIPVINAGDGGHQHPTQTLTDLLTIRSLKGRLDNITIGLCGDLKFGRTVHSLIEALVRYNNVKFVLISPEELRIPSYIREDVLKKNNIEFLEVERLEDAIPELDILYMTRVQKERFFNEEDYVRMKDFYILDKQKLSLAKDDMYILHPLPRVNEISVEVDSDPRAAYFKQAQYGVYVRMALILTLLEVELPC